MSDEVEFIFGAEKVALIENRPISVNECYRDLYEAAGAADATACSRIGSW